MAAVGFGWLPKDYLALDVPKALLQAGGLILGLLGFMTLAKDHRVSETITSLALLALALGAGWLTFIAPPGTAHKYLPFIPVEVNDALGRLLFGIGTAACFGIAFFVLRRMSR